MEVAIFPSRIEPEMPPLTSDSRWSVSDFNRSWRSSLPVTLITYNFANKNNKSLFNSSLVSVAPHEVCHETLVLWDRFRAYCETSQSLKSIPGQRSKKLEEFSRNTNWVHWKGFISNTTKLVWAEVICSKELSIHIYIQNIIPRYIHIQYCDFFILQHKTFVKVHWNALR